MRRRQLLLFLSIIAGLQGCAPPPFRGAVGLALENVQLVVPMSLMIDEGQEVTRVPVRVND
jgi:hypothetical protein